MKRREGWEQYWADFISAASVREFEWGTCDCCLFACDGVEVLTGTDPAAPFRGTYRTIAGARRALKKFAGDGLEAAASFPPQR